MPTFPQLFGMSFMIIQIILQIESDAFCPSGLVVMGFLLWEEGSGKQDLSVVEGRGFLCQVFERYPLVLIDLFTDTAAILN